MKGYSAFHKDPVQKPHHLTVLRHIQDTQWCVVSYYTIQQRCSRCILRPQLTGVLMSTVEEIALVYTYILDWTQEYWPWIGIPHSPELTIRHSVCHTQDAPFSKDLTPLQRMRKRIHRPAYRGTVYDKLGRYISLLYNPFLQNGGKEFVLHLNNKKRKR